MSDKKDTNGFELQTTVALHDGKQSKPTDTPKEQTNSSSVKGPPKPSKSSTLPNNNGSTATVENGNKSKTAEAAELSGENFITLNVGFFKSWQALLRIIKFVCFIAMLICLAHSISEITSRLPKTERFAKVWDGVKSLNYGVALSVIGLILQILEFIFFFLGFNKIVNKLFHSMSWVFFGVHLVMLILCFAAPIAIILRQWTGTAITFFIAFDMLALGGYAVELYLDVDGMKGGPELSNLPCF